jgi:limonene-1,2-epoxide hydrolase
MAVRTTRGRFLLAGLAVAIPREAEAADPTPLEEANLALVTAFCESFATRDIDSIASFLSPTCVYRITESAAPLTGDAAVERIRGYLERAATVEFKILESWVKGPVVMNERVDTFVSPERTTSYHLTGVFFVKDNKIEEWTDYSIR